MVSYDMYQLSTLWSGCKVPGGPWNGSRWKRLSIQRIQHLKTPLFLKISSWTLWGSGGSWGIWRCGHTCINSMKLMWKFHPNPTSGSLSRLYLSSKSLPGVLEERGVHEEPGNGVIWNVSPSEVAVCHMTRINSMKLMWKFHISFIRILPFIWYHLLVHQELPYPPRLQEETWRTGRVLTEFLKLDLD